MVALSENDIRFFKINGFVIKRSVLDPKLMARARKRMWAGAPSRITPDDPLSWVGPFREDEESEDGMNFRRGFIWKYREPGYEPFIFDMLARNPSVRMMAEQLLGPDLLVGNAEPERIRGIYCTLPYGDAEVPERPPGCHVDGGYPFHLGVSGYIDFVPPGGGGFSVWPRSHRTFYYDFHSQYRDEHTEKYYEDLDYFAKRGEYVDCHGGPGDIVLWHNRIAHAAAPNGSKQIRKAVLCDFRKTDLAWTKEEPPCDDMWRDWSDAIREIKIDA